MLGEVEVLIMSPCNTELRAGNQRVGSVQAQSLYTSVNRLSECLLYIFDLETKI